jgi:hypothetical protein
MSNPSVRWLLVGPRDLPSSRNHGYRIHQYLKDRGWESQLVVTPLHQLDDTPLLPRDITQSRCFQNGDIVVFQKLYGPTTVAVLQSLKRLEVSTVFIDCDYPLKMAEAQLATVTVCPSDSLAAAYRKEGVSNVVVIPESWEANCPPRRVTKNNTKLRCVWFGMSDPLKEIELRSLRQLQAEQLPEFKLIVVSDHQSADVQWNGDDSWDVIRQCDIAVITGNDYFWTQAKSANRVIQAMALGLPVVAYPLPAYRAVVRHGRNGMLAKEAHEWICALSAMQDPDLRARVAAAGYRYARRYFCLDRIGEQWCALFKQLGTAPVSRSSIREVVTELRLRRLRSRAFRRMAASLEPQLGLYRSYKVLAWKKWIQ